MDKLDALESFAALSQQTRLDVFRLLIKAGPEGMLSGEIGDALAVKQNTMSANLSVLLNAGLVRKQRDGRTIRYFISFEAIRDLISFLMEDCCGGRPEICAPLLNDLRLSC